MTRNWLRTISATALLATLGSGLAAAQVPESVYQQLKAMGQVVDVSCTAKLYRTMMPANDYDTWWAPGAARPEPKVASRAAAATVHCQVLVIVSPQAVRSVRRPPETIGPLCAVNFDIGRSARSEPHFRSH